MLNFDKLFTAEGLLYVGLKAARDFAVVFAGLVSVDGFVLSQESMGKALLAALSTTAFRVARYAYERVTSPS